MKFLTKLTINKEKLKQFKSYENKVTKHFTLKEYYGWILFSNRKRPVYTATCNSCNALVVIPVIYANDTSKGFLSCECKRKTLSDIERTKQTIDSLVFVNLYNSYIRNAKNRNFEFKLSIEEFFDFTQHKCFYCGVKPYQVLCKRNSKNKSIERSFIYNGIDRVDNNKCYTIDNCVPCCGKCNMMKRSLSKKEFINHSIKIANHFKQLAAINSVNSEEA